MKRSHALIGGLFFVMSITLSACAGAPDDSPGLFEQDAQNMPQTPALADLTEHQPSQPVEQEELFPAQATMDDCGCGDLIDEDSDGVCDHAANGECRRGVNGRCPCGMGVPGDG